MRLWTVHPKYLDPQGLVAVWREGLLALKVLRGQTKGYKHHPQLCRFRDSGSPVAYMLAYLRGIVEEAERRAYNFDRSKIAGASCVRAPISESAGQLDYEWAHLLAKLKIRSEALFREHRHIKHPDPHPLFKIVPGGIREWERVGE